jgi:hypothetical protein
MQAVLVSAQSAATIQTSYFAATAPCVFSSGLGTHCGRCDAERRPGIAAGYTERLPAADVQRQHRGEAGDVGDITDRRWLRGACHTLFRQHVGRAVVQ